MTTRLFVELPGRCEATCPSCSTPVDAPLDAPRYGALFHAAALLGFDFIGLMGREPMAQEGSVSVLRAAVATGARVRVYSTLFGGTGPEQLPDIASALEVTVLLWGTAERHDAATGSSGSFDETLALAARWQDAGSSVMVKVPVDRSLLSCLPGLERAVTSAGLRFTAAPWWPANQPPNALPILAPTPVELARMFTESGAFTGFDYSPHSAVCKAGRARAFVDERLRLFSCFESTQPVADLRVEDLAEVWMNDRRWGPWRQAALQDLPECSSCEVSHGCHICPAPLFDGRGNICSEHQLGVASATSVALTARVGGGR